MLSQITKDQLKEIPLEDLEKCFEILIHNLRVELKRVRFERNRKDGDFSFTAQLLEEVEVKPRLLDVLEMAECVNWKRKNAK